MRQLLAILVLLATSICSKSEKAFDDLLIGGTSHVKDGAIFRIDSGATFTYQAGAIFSGDTAEFREDVGLKIGTDVQGWNANLSAIAGATSATDKFFYFTSSGAGSMATVTETARSLLDDVNALAMRSTLGLVIGTNVQAWNENLDAAAAGVFIGGFTGTVSSGGEELDATFHQISSSYTGAPTSYMVNWSNNWTSGTVFGLDHDSVTVLSFGYNGLVTSTAGFAGPGAGLSALNASNLASGTVAAARMPALTGAVTTSAGAVATTLTPASTSATSFTTQYFYTNQSGGGSKSLPVYTRASDPNTGVYFSGADEYAIVTGAGRRVRFTGTGDESSTPGVADFSAYVEIPDGLSTVPSLYFDGDTDSGFAYSDASDFVYTIVKGEPIYWVGPAGITIGSGNSITAVSGADLNLTTNINRDINLTPGSGGFVTLGKATTITGNLTLGTAGNGIQIKEGSNATSGSATLSGGTVTVSTTAITTAAHVVLSRESINSSTALGQLTKGTVVNTTSFVINALKPADATVETNDISIVHWMIIKPAP